MSKRREKRTDNSDKRRINEELIWVIIFTVLVLYIIFLIMKINGIGDYTSKYGIEWIRDREGYNSVMIIDGDVETTWGMLENFSKGSTIQMKFKEERSIGKISILNCSDIESVPIDIYVAGKDGNYNKCSYDVSKEEKKVIYTMKEPFCGEYLAFVYLLEETGHWPITEVEIYE